MIATLNESFVNTWIVRPQFLTPPEIEASFATEGARQVARAIAMFYTYPVDSLVLTPDGKVVAQLSFDEWYRHLDFDAWNRTYAKLLEDGLRGVSGAK